jgi:hypothetical protein
MASFTSVLSSIGKTLKAFFSSAAVKDVEAVVVPVVETMFPAVTPLLTGLTAAVGKAESLAAAAGAQNGTDAQKLALALGESEAVFAAYEQARGVTIPLAGKTAIVNSIVAVLNELPG